MAMIMPLKDRQCLEAKVRQVLATDIPKGDGGVVDAFPVLEALGNIMAECLAHLSDEAADHVMRSVLMHRRAWMAQAQVLAQVPVRGRG